MTQIWLQGVLFIQIVRQNASEMVFGGHCRLQETTFSWLSVKFPEKVIISSKIHADNMQYIDNKYYFDRRDIKWNESKNELMKILPGTKLYGIRW